MKFTDRCPATWKELQDDVALLLNQSGYRAVSPCTIDTVRGKVEVDVLVESPDELVKRIVCECKFWNSSVPKEKVHAFRTVVQDSGASFGSFDFTSRLPIRCNRGCKSFKCTLDDVE